MAEEATPVAARRRAVAANPVEAAYVKLPGAAKAVNASQQSGRWQDWAIGGDGGAVGEHGGRGERCNMDLVAHPAHVVFFGAPGEGHTRLHHRWGEPRALPRRPKTRHGSERCERRG